MERKGVIENPEGEAWASLQVRLSEALSTRDPQILLEVIRALKELQRDFLVEQRTTEEQDKEIQIFYEKISDLIKAIVLRSDVINKTEFNELLKKIVLLIYGEKPDQTELLILFGTAKNLLQSCLDHELGNLKTARFNAISFAIQDLDKLMATVQASEIDMDWDKLKARLNISPKQTV